MPQEPSSTIVVHVHQGTLDFAIAAAIGAGATLLGFALTMLWEWQKRAGSGAIRIA